MKKILFALAISFCFVGSAYAETSTTIGGVTITSGGGTNTVSTDTGGGVVIASILAGN